MKKLIVFILVLLLTATPALAKKNKGHHKGHGPHHGPQCKPEPPKPEPPTPGPTPEPPSPEPYGGWGTTPSDNGGQEAIIPRCIEPFTGTPQPCYPPRSKGTLIEMLRPKSIHSKGAIWMIIQPD